MKFTQVAADAFKKLQLNAGVLLTEFDPANPGTSASLKSKIFAATSGGVSFATNPEYVDFGEDIDNVPPNTKQLKRLQSVNPVLSGTAKTVDNSTVKRLMAAADVSGNKVTPRESIALSDFQDIWWVGDYSDANSGDDAGFVAIRLINALSTGGFQIQSNDDGKGDFAFEFTGHYDIDDSTVLPYEVYVVEGESSSTLLSALTIASATLVPTFDPYVTNYTATTTSASGAVTATAQDNTATVTIKNGSTTVTSGSSASWSSGNNGLTVTVTNDGESRVYSVVVVKS